MVSKTLKVDRTPSGIATMSAGGGAFTNTYQAITILKTIPVGYDREKTVYDLKNAGLIKTAGHLASSTEQAIIPVDIGDVVVFLSGKLPISDLNPDAEYQRTGSLRSTTRTQMESRSRSPTPRSHNR
jgi:hypothetical protein